MLMQDTCPAHDLVAITCAAVECSCSVWCRGPPIRHHGVKLPGLQAQTLQTMSVRATRSTRQISHIALGVGGGRTLLSVVDPSVCCHSCRTPTIPHLDCSPQVERSVARQMQRCHVLSCGRRQSTPATFNNRSVPVWFGCDPGRRPCRIDSAEANRLRSVDGSRHVLANAGAALARHVQCRCRVGCVCALLREPYQDQARPRPRSLCHA